MGIVDLVLVAEELLDTELPDTCQSSYTLKTDCCIHSAVGLTSALLIEGLFFEIL